MEEINISQRIKNGKEITQALKKDKSIVTRNGYRNKDWEALNQVMKTAQNVSVQIKSINASDGTPRG